MARDLASDADFEVTAVDLNPENLRKLGPVANIKTVTTDLGNPTQVKAVIKDADVVVAGLPSAIGFQTLRTVIELGKAYCDISFMPEDALELDDLAKKHGVTAVVDWGDGTVEPATLEETDGSGTVAGSHMYGDTGSYVVTVTVTDDEEDSGLDTLTVNVGVNLAPTVRAISPSSGTFSGGTPVTITGESFQTAAAAGVDGQVGVTVKIGDGFATDVEVVSATRITATTPPGPEGSVDVVVTNADGQSGVLSDGFIYIGPTVAISVAPQTATVAGCHPK